MRRAFTTLPWATVNPETLSSSNPAKLYNLANGQWTSTKNFIDLPDPIHDKTFVSVPNTSVNELEPYLQSVSKVTKSGLHNPLKNVERYLLYGRICQRAATLLNEDATFNYFEKLIQRFIPKHTAQSTGELKVLKDFIENFAGDNVRFLAEGFSVPGDHLGQQSHGYRWPYGPVGLICPFNFPLEIPGLQMMGALFMGNQITVKPDMRGAVCLEQWVRFLHYCGMPLQDVNILNGDGQAMEELIKRDVLRNVLFTGSSKVGDKLAQLTKGKIKLEDAGFDWKVLGPDVHDLDFVAYTSDQDAYAFSGQKCSAQSIILAHKNWANAGLYEKLAKNASRRNFEDLSIGPVLSWDNARIQKHVDAVSALPGAKILFGGKPVEGTSVPKRYGVYYPTAVFVPISQIKANFELVTTELFGPFQIVTEWEDLEDVLEILERLNQHLTAAVVSKDTQFLQKVLGRTVNGTTYAGIRARTTGAPQNHWFGPAGDPRSGGIGTIGAIKAMWSCHREIISDMGPVQEGWTQPGPS